jgi:glutaredoxin-like protein
MSLLSEKDRQHLQNEFADLQHPVHLVVFSQDMECQFCRETRQIAEEVAALSDLISLKMYDLVRDAEIAQEYGINKIPAVLLMQGGEIPKDYGIRYFGAPSGYEFTSLVHDILMVGRGDSGLAESTRQWLAQLTTPIHLQVFVTPTCPYCPRAVLLAHQFAMESEMVTADMVEATEFPDMAIKYQVMGVPRTVINETLYQEGAAPEGFLLAKLQEAVQQVQ